MKKESNDFLTKIENSVEAGLSMAAGNIAKESDDLMYKDYACYFKLDKMTPYEKCVLDGGSEYCVMVNKQKITNKKDCRYWKPKLEPKRITWDQFFMQIAEVAAQRSTCIRRAVGAVLTKNNMIISSGYNGAPKNSLHCFITGCIRKQENIPSGECHEKCRGVHAEQNAIIQCASSGSSCLGGTIYSTTYPCSICAKMIVNAGIKRVVYAGNYPDPLAKEIFKEAKIKIYTYKR